MKYNELIEVMAKALYGVRLTDGGGQMSWEDVVVKFPDTAADYRNQARSTFEALQDAGKRYHELKNLKEDD